jgi:hypothetical protein
MRGFSVAAWNLAVALRAPVLAIFIVLTYTVTNRVGLVASPEELSAALLTFFTQYGALVVAPLCFLESFAPFNGWFPGALAILTAMSSTTGNIPAAVEMFFVIWFFSLVGLLASFLTGRFLHARSEKGPRPE